MSEDRASWEMAPTQRPPPPTDTDRPSVHRISQVGDPGEEYERDERHHRLMEYLQKIDRKVDSLATEVSKERALSRQAWEQVDRLSQQFGETSTMLQAVLFRLDEGNGLNKCNVFLVEDDELVGKQMVRWLTDGGASFTWERTENAAIHAVRALRPEQAPTHAIVDVKLGGGYGVDVARVIRDRFGERTRRILYTGFTDESIPPGVAHAIVNKPYDPKALRAELTTMPTRSGP